jgi:DNA-binding NarL/FixJ family response regulator
MDARVGEPFLTERQLQLAQLMANGFTRREAAEMMGLSTRTLEVHTLHIRHKMKARNLFHGIAKLIAMGIVTVDGIERKD